VILLIGFRDDEVERIEEVLGEEVFSVGEGGLNREVSEVLSSPRGYHGYADVGGKFLIMHEIPGERVGEIVKGVKGVVGEVIPATTTPTSLRWRLSDLLEELKKEDEYFRSLRSPPNTS